MLLCRWPRASAAHLRSRPTAPATDHRPASPRTAATASCACPLRTRARRPSPLAACAAHAAAPASPLPRGRPASHAAVRAPGTGDPAPTTPLGCPAKSWRPRPAKAPRAL
nr:translation initiation factor IF-2-like [Aegilops tauschii subsp. strangulata]